LKQVSLKSYYTDIGYLTQEPSVFDGTVRENLLYAVSEEIRDADLEITIQLANCEFIYDLPQ
jgi:ABC-type multidrug transport system fused ATPase/permease subunit